MILKSKAATPAQAGTLGMTALEQQSHRKNNTIKRIFRQQIKRIIVLLAVHGLLPVAWAEWLLMKGGLIHV